jgi:hypothetical protein
LRTVPAPLLSDPTHDCFTLEGRALVERAVQLVARFHGTPPPSVILSAAEAAVAVEAAVAPRRDSADTVRKEPTCRSSTKKLLPAT